MLPGGGSFIAQQVVVKLPQSWRSRRARNSTTNQQKCFEGKVNSNLVLIARQLCLKQPRTEDRRVIKWKVKLSVQQWNLIYSTQTVSAYQLLTLFIFNDEMHFWSETAISWLQKRGGGLLVASVSCLLWPGVFVLLSGPDLMYKEAERSRSAE